MTVHNYNASGDWGVDAVQARYEEYARRYRVKVRADLAPREHCKGGVRWVYPVMERVIEGIDRGDPACAEIGVEFIEESASFPFGMMLKASTARALRRAELNAGQKVRIRRRIVEMLRTAYLPREFREYAKLVCRIGMGDRLACLDELSDSSNPWVRHYCERFKACP
jgi:hypothetical protein